MSEWYVYLLWQFSERWEHDVLVDVFETEEGAEQRRREIDGTGRSTVIHKRQVIGASERKEQTQ